MVCNLRDQTFVSHLWFRRLAPDYHVIGSLGTYPRLAQYQIVFGRYGKEQPHFRKHRNDAVRFLKSVERAHYSSPIATKYQERMGKYGSKLFTFLDYDVVPWNNNNAEHAIKGFARVRRFADGRFTEDSIREYLVMLSAAQTCGYQNFEVLEFLLAQANNSSACQLSLQ
jgi:hypothetical protein